MVPIASKECWVYIYTLKRGDRVDKFTFDSNPSVKVSSIHFNLILCIVQTNIYHRVESQVKVGDNFPKLHNYGEF